MIVANTNYTNSLLKSEQFKTMILEFEREISNQMPKGIIDQYDNSKSKFLNCLEEIEITLNEFEINKNKY